MCPSAFLEGWWEGKRVVVVSAHLCLLVPTHAFVATCGLAPACALVPACTLVPFFAYPIALLEG